MPHQGGRREEEGGRDGLAAREGRLGEREGDGSGSVGAGELDGDVGISCLGEAVARGVEAEVAVVAVGGEMGEEDVAGGADIAKLREEASADVVGEMALVGEDALDEMGRAAAVAEAARLVVGLEDEDVAVGEILANGRGGGAKVGGDADREAAAFDTIAHGVEGVVGHAEGGDAEGADMEGAGGHQVVPGELAVGVGGAGGVAGGVDGEAELFLEHADAGDVVAVLVGEADGMDGG